MKKAGESKRALRVGDDAVKAKTGKTWSEWFALLDAAGAKKMPHKEIALYLHEKQDLPGWWSQMVTVGYEQERGSRVEHQRPDGYSINRSKTLPVPLSRLFQAWHNAKTRGRWLAAKGLVVRKATPEKSLRITWEDGTSSVEVLFCAKGEAKSQVNVQHGKLASAAEGEQMKIYWGEALSRLATLLEK